MPITINGSGTVTGISTGGLPDGCIATADLADNAVTTAKLGSGEASGLAKAWVNFNGTGTVAIRASYNVSSITDLGVGTYQVNFTTAMIDTNYTVFNFCSTTTGAGFPTSLLQSQSTGNTVIYLGQNVGGASDAATVCVSIFR